MPLSAACSTEEQVRIIASPTTASGGPAQVDGPLKISVQSGPGRVEQNPDKPLEAVLVSDEPGTTSYLIEADADLGEGVEPISDTAEVVVEGARAVAFGLSVAGVEPKGTPA